MTNPIPRDDETRALILLRLHVALVEAKFGSAEIVVRQHEVDGERTGEITISVVRQEK